MGRWSERWWEGWEGSGGGGELSFFKGGSICWE